MTYRGRIYDNIKHDMEGSKLSLCSGYKLRKDTPYFAFMGELLGVFSEFFESKYG